MNPVSLTIRELRHRWKSSLLVAIIVAVTTGALTYFAVNNAGFQKEIGRNARDIGSNVVILPADLDQFQYHSDGGYSDVTMSMDLIEQLIQNKASLNHLIPMLERKADCTFGERTANARVVGISASIPMPGRPPAPMQKSVEKNKVQLGSQLAEKLGIQRDQTPEIQVRGNLFQVSRVNRANGTWQDAAAFFDLETAQDLFGIPGRISRIEAIECTSEQCEQTGLKSEVVLASELARITDQASILRREKMADARTGIRIISRENLRMLQNVLWFVLAIVIMAVSSLNAHQRSSEIGVLQALGYGQYRVMTLFILRAVVLTVLGAVVGVWAGMGIAQYQSQSLFVSTGKNLSVDWTSAMIVGITATLIAALASSIPAFLSGMRHPADIIGKES